MIESIQFKNFKVLRDATLPLGRCTVIVGPNGSGKSTILNALKAFQKPKDLKFDRMLSATAVQDKNAVIEIRLNFGRPSPGLQHWARWPRGGQPEVGREQRGGRQGPDVDIRSIRVFSFDPEAIAQPAQVDQKSELAHNGAGLAAVLDRLRDTAPERFHAINTELGEWLPEFDSILFEPSAGKKSITLRTRDGHYPIPAADLSQGTLIALALLTLAYLPDPPALIGLEEPDRGIHPRLLRHVKDAIYRLSHPEGQGEKRPPVQVIATTHSPYFLDLFKDHPEEIVVANKVGLEATFQRVSEQSSIHEILSEASLGEVWYSGILGGVPAKS
jgi:predicted ATPase